MKKILGFVVFAGLTACNHAGELKIETDSLQSDLDTLINKVKRSEVVDSIQTKGARLLDSIEIKTDGFLDSGNGKANRN